jgi:hypothetical protein
MELVLIIKNSSYINPFSINRGSSVACTLSDTLESYPLLPRKTLRKRHNKRQLSVPK